MNTDKGFSLVELMIVMALSLTLLVGVLAVFNSHKQAFEFMHTANEQQENGRVSVALMTESLRMADHWAGIPAEEVVVGSTMLSSAPGACSAGWLFDSTEALRGYDGKLEVTQVTHFPPGCIAKQDYVKNSDLLMLRYADGRSLINDDDIFSAKNSQQYFVRLTTGLAAYVFMGANASKAISEIPYESGTYNMRYRAELYFLRPCSHKTRGQCKDGLPTLTRLTLNGNKFSQQALVEGIEQLQFSYGVDQSGNQEIDYYQSANEVLEWKSVISVRLSLIARGLNKDVNFDEVGKEYLMEGDMEERDSGYRVSQSDKHYRRKLYRREVFIRNRGRS